MFLLMVAQFSAQEKVTSVLTLSEYLSYVKKISPNCKTSQFSD